MRATMAVVFRERIFFLSHEMLNPSYGLFEYRFTTTTLRIFLFSGMIVDHLDYFNFIRHVLSFEDTRK